MVIMSIEGGTCGVTFGSGYGGGLVRVLTASLPTAIANSL
jgi:hypothetical protein